MRETKIFKAGEKLGKICYIKTMSKISNAEFPQVERTGFKLARCDVVKPENKRYLSSGK